MNIDWITIVAEAVAVVGIVQFLKNAKNWLPIPEWVWWLALPVVAIGVALAVNYGPKWTISALLVLALAQLGYENIVKLVQKKIDAA